MNEIVSQFDTLTIDEVIRDSWRGFRLPAGFDNLKAELDKLRAESELLSKELDDALMQRGAWQDAAARWEREFCGKVAELDQSRRDLRSALADRDVALADLDAARAEIETLRKRHNEIGQVTGNGDGTETRILPVRMTCGLVPDGYEVIRAVSRGLTVTPPLLADCGDVLYDELPSCEWERGEFRLQLKPKATP